MLWKLLLTFRIFIHLQVQIQIMQTEECPTQDDATGLEEVACDGPRTPPPKHSSTTGRNTMEAFGCQ